MRSCFKVVYLGDDNFGHFRYVLATDAKDARQRMKRLPCDHIYTVAKTRNPLSFLIAKLCEKFGG